MSNLEPLWRFVGYLHFLDDPGRDHASFSGFGEARARAVADSGPSLPPGHAPLAFDDLESIPLAPPRIVESDASFHLTPLLGGLVPLKPVASPALFSLPKDMQPRPDDVLPSAQDAQDYVGAREYLLDYGHEVANTLLVVNQSNVLVLTAEYLGSDGQIVLPVQADPGAALDVMMHHADALVPRALHVPEVSGSPLVDMVRAYAEDRSAARGEDAGEEPPTWNVKVRDGHPATDAEARPQPFVAPEAPNHGPSQVVHLGDNHTVNAAVLVDANAPGATRIVLGDMHQTDAILQTNVLMERLAVEQSGGSASIWLGHDVTANVASLVQHAWTPGPAGVAADGLHVKVDTIEGDVWSVKSVTQSNWLDTRNIAVETETHAFSTVTIGGNIQVNLAEFQHWTTQYDMVVVLGNYYGFNLVQQTNILYHDANLTVAGGEQEAGPQTIIAGGNSLTNIASIEHYGTESLHPLAQGQADFAAQLASGAAFGQESWTSYAGSATGSLRVLAITGDYYDVNLVSQLNVLASSEIGILSASGEGVPQYVAAGLNTAANEAHIITSGAGEAFIGGQHYSDSLMIQANLIEPGSTLSKPDPTALVNEAVAFVGDHVAVQDSNPTVQIHSNHDPNLHMNDLGAVMS
jgi:hypothetical protein